MEKTVKASAHQKPLFSMPLFLIPLILIKEWRLKRVLSSGLFVGLALGLAACGDNSLLIITAQPSTNTASSSTPASTPASSSASASEPKQADDLVEGEPQINITVNGDDAAIPPEETIASIIAQLKKAKPNDDITDDTLELTTALTRSNLKPSVSEDPPPNSVIWTLDSQSPLKPPANSEVTIKNRPLASGQATIPAIIPEGQDPSLAVDALAAAFAMIRQSAKLDDELIQPETTPTAIISKNPSVLRAAVLMPLEGLAETIGRDMRRGAELAVFTLGNQDIDLTFHDTSRDVVKSAQNAIAQGADVIIGPLFSENTRRVRPMAAAAGIPVLSFSNDSTIAGGGVWLMGQTPEQDVDTVLRKALAEVEPIDPKARNVPHMAIIAENNDYGQRVSQYAISVLSEKALATADLLTLSPDVLNDEKALKQSIKNLTGWLPASSEGVVKTPKYDMVLIAGNVPFSLRVAPVLSWYDLNPEEVQYLGTSTWNTAAILQEPSLMQGWFADAPQANHDRFQQIWLDHFDQPASKHAILAFDAVAMASTLNASSPDTLTASLTNNQGFSGFSGLFRLNLDGRNTRLLEIRQIAANQAEVIVPAGKKF